ncbi:hypothetical protein BCV72DRAFT_338166 [Rhizopus microsporus var. microsporus]|uniref:Uncharacterized protein n=2 Tax=Rhizopus microsporus TaxID=58291 RepID=A0A2G4SES4_RHIZD|nr:uncharacterized protein RHIMIDRAFT_296042 [Rhizopus microsporus ATCC 52813]ORE03188.1 hypothetical protein BCV72DRAFT_338166 [Rhizopus microsporus var. microsporus]PHZ07291.1 hypothetical protein RHIMIDRAFT_296042 [Rhizopus microsporus ATCC 52813]
MTDMEKSVEKKRVNCDSVETEMGDGFRDQDFVDSRGSRKEIRELFDIPNEENDDNNEEEEEVTNDKEEQDGFMNLLSTINFRGVSLALNNAKFPAMEQTALYRTGCLVKEYIKHLSENLSENEQEIEQVIKKTIEQHKPKMTFEEMDKS